MTKMESIKQLRRHLSGLFDSRHSGVHSMAYVKSQGYIDGYMQAMSDLGVVNDRELLKIVSNERSLAAERADGSSKKFKLKKTLETFA